MRLLVVNKFWYSRGGLERVMFNEIAMLGSAGHEIAHFSTRHPSNDPSPWESYFAEHIDLGAEGLAMREKALAVGRMLANREATARFRFLLDDFEPELIHAHGVHRQLSPSILLEAARRGIPVVQTVHDYHHVCPCDILVVDDQPCQPPRCKRAWYGAAVAHACMKHSRSKSVLSALETGFQRVRRAYDRSVTRFIAPSRYLAETMRRGGWRLPIDVVPNAVAVPPAASTPATGPVAYAGRLAPGKGVETLLTAADQAGVDIIVAGEGPEQVALRRGHPRTRFLGRCEADGVQVLLSRCSAAVVPSSWPENAPMSVLEPMALGRAVIASAIGGIPEIVTDGVDGLLVPPGDIAAVAEALRSVTSDPLFAEELGRNARRTVMERFSPERHLALLLETYDKAMTT